MLRAIAAKGITLACCVAALAAAAPRARAQASDSSRIAGLDEPQMIERDLSGPRVGFTLRVDEPAGSFKDVGRVVSQFGWHFEHVISADHHGPQFLTEFVPLFGGVEYGKVIPSFNFGIGARLPNGFEFGVGPSVSAWQDNGGSSLRSAVFFAVGRSYDYGGVRVPVNLVVSTNPKGTRISLLTGYAIRRASRPVAP